MLTKTLFKIVMQIDTLNTKYEADVSAKQLVRSMGNKFQKKVLIKSFSFIFFTVFFGGFVHRNVVLEGLENSCFQLLSQIFLHEFLPDRNSCICTGFLQIPPDSSGFLRISPDFSRFLFPLKAVWLGQGTSSPPTSSPTSKLPSAPKHFHALPISPKRSQALPSTPGGSTAAGQLRQAAWQQNSGDSVAVASAARQWLPAWQLGSLAAA